MIGYINVYSDGGTSRLCASRLVADNAAKAVLSRAETRLCVWRVECDDDGMNPKISVEAVR